MKSLTIPCSGKKLYDGSVVMLPRFPEVRWVVHWGWYNYQNRQRQGWYLTAVPSNTVIPLEATDLETLVVIDPQTACPPGGLLEQLRRAFISVDTIQQMTSMPRDQLCDGKLFRVNYPNYDGDPGTIDPDTNSDPEYWVALYCGTPHDGGFYEFQKVDFGGGGSSEEIKELQEAVAAIEKAITIKGLQSLSSDNSVIVKSGDSDQPYGDSGYALGGVTLAAEPSATTLATEAAVADAISGVAVSVTVEGQGNVITDMSANGGTITATKGSTAVLTSGDQTVDGVKTFSVPPVSATDPTDNSDVANKGYVDTAISDSISALGPMVFIGTVGTGGTVADLPTASAAIVGNAYVVITDGTYAGQSAKVGDLFICSSAPAWVLIPSGDEPAGTVTNVATGSGLTGGPITSSGTISHDDTSNVQDVEPTESYFVNGITFDGFGHVLTVSTAVASSSEYESDEAVEEMLEELGLNTDDLDPAVVGEALVGSAILSA